jgi:glyoxylase-like metal-dependent hydrolase (beta-lactamase superfamily II)
VQSFVIRAGGRTVLVDTCIGEGKDCPDIPVWHRRRGTGFLERLAGAGVDPADVDIVFCTHLHVDHVGWNTRRADGRWVPTFPNARYLIGRDELADWAARRAAGGAPDMHILALQDSVLPVVEAALVDLADDGYDVAEGLTLMRLPGHTAGQMGLRVDGGDGHAVFCGDAVHSPVQIFEPGVRLRPAPTRLPLRRPGALSSKTPWRPAACSCRPISAAPAARASATAPPASSRCSADSTEQSLVHVSRAGARHAHHPSLALRHESRPSGRVRTCPHSVMLVLGTRIHDLCRRGAAAGRAGPTRPDS